MADESASPVTEFDVGMTCGGCSRAVTKILTKMDGVESVDCDVPTKKVRVTGTASPEDMLAALTRWGEASGKSVALASA